MPSDEYWNGDPYLVGFYKKAHLLKVEKRNEELWWQGAYFYDAVSTAINNAFRKKGTKPRKYIEQPIRLTPLSKREKKLKAIEERKRAIAHFTRLEKMMNKSDRLKTIEGQDQNKPKKPKKGKTDK